MEPALILVMMLMGWLTVAFAMLWGMMRIARRHQPRTRSTPHHAHPTALPTLPPCPPGTPDRHSRFLNKPVTAAFKAVECASRDGAVW